MELEWDDVGWKTTDEIPSMWIECGNIGTGVFCSNTKMSYLYIRKSQNVLRRNMYQQWQGMVDATDSVIVSWRR